MITNRLNREVSVYAVTPFARKHLITLRSGVSAKVPDIAKEDMYLHVLVGDTLFAEGKSVVGQNVLIGGITTFYDPGHLGGLFGAMGQGLPPLEIINSTRIPLSINSTYIESGKRECIKGPAGLWTIPLGFYVQDDNELFPRFRITQPMTHAMYNGLQLVDISPPVVDKWRVSLQSGSESDFSVRSTGLTFW